MFFETEGTGKPLILIPGFASGAWTWFRQTKDLARNFQVITFDPRGIGKSKLADSERGNISMKTFVEDVLHILNELEIEKANVLGASFGGFVAQEFAVSFPERVDKLVLACTSYGGKNHVKPDLEILRSFTPDSTQPIIERIRKFFRPAFTEEFHAKRAGEVEEVCRLREENEVSEATYSAQLQVAFSFDMENKIGAINHQTLVITGDMDNLVPMQNSVNIAKKLPNAKLEIIMNGSHMFFIENAAEFNKIVSRFVGNS